MAITPAHSRWVKRKWKDDPSYRAAERVRIAAWKEKNRDELRQESRDAGFVIKAEIFSYYGGSICQLCPETRIAALNLDHINGGGTDHRRSLGKAGKNFYQWAIKNNYPPGYRVLCSNCNWLAHLETLVDLPASAQRKHIANLKSRMITALGGVCVQCGKTDIRILTVHHPNNDGAEHRRLISNGASGFPFYRAVFRSGDFSGLECLCFSCNDAEPRWKKMLSNSDATELGGETPNSQENHND